MQNGDSQNELDGRAQVLHHANDRERQGLGSRRKEHQRNNGDHAGGREKPEMSGAFAEEGHLSLSIEHKEGGNAEGRQNQSFERE